MFHKVGLARLSECNLRRVHLHPLQEPDGHLSAYPARHLFNLKESALNFVQYMRFVETVLA